MRWMILIGVTVGIAANFPLSRGTPPVYVAHLVVSLLVTASVLATVHHAGWRAINAQPRVLLSGALVLVASVVGITNPQFIADFAKIAVLVGTYYGFSLLFVNWKVQIRVLAAALLIGVLGSTLLLVEPWSAWETLVALSIQSRLAIGALGGFNTYAFLISIAGTSLLYLCVSAWQMGRRLTVLLGGVLIAMYLSMFLLATLSRGGMISTVLGAVVYGALSRVRHVLIPLLAVGGVALIVCLTMLVSVPPELLQRYLFIEDATGSGRTIIWKLLLSEWMNSPMSVLVGRGVGSVEFRSGDLIIESAHNGYVDVIFRFGLVGFMALLAWLLMLFRRVAKAPASEERAFLAAILVQITVGSAFDSYWAAAQVGWLMAVLMASAHHVGLVTALGPVPTAE